MNDRRKSVAYFIKEILKYGHLKNKSKENEKKTTTPLATIATYIH